MSDATSFLAAGPLPRINPGFQIVSTLGRVGDHLVYDARDGDRPARLLEYAPAGAVERGRDGWLRPADPRFDPAWRASIARFLAQGECLGRVKHPGVAPIWQVVGTSDGDSPGAYLVGAPVGESLEAAIARGLPLSPAGIVRIANELAAALAEIHARGLTHLDISPATVSISGGRLQLSDFAVDNRAFMPLLQSQAGLVRPGYSPIELHDGAGAEPLGPPADIYAASALLFALITGQAPAPWQQRWRDPSAGQLADRNAFPPALIDAIRKGLSVEPEERFRDGTDWLAALSGAAPPRGPAPESSSASARAATPDAVAPSSSSAAWSSLGSSAAAAPLRPRSPPVPVGGTPPSTARAGTAGHLVEPSPFPPPPRRSRGLVPLLVLGLILLALAAGGLFAWQQGWFAPAAEEPVATVAKPRTQRTKAPVRDAAIPAVEVGGTVSGQLTRRDQRRPSGQYQDSFSLAGRSGQRVELRLGSTDFDPLLSVTGPGFSAANDDDTEQGSTNSRLAITLPRTGTYTISVSSYASGQTGNYVLEIAEPRAEVAIVTPGMLTGRWRRPADMECSDPVTIRVDGRQIEYSQRDFSAVGRLLDGVGQTIRAEMESGPEGEGGEAAFLLAEDGGSFTSEGETWVRC